MEGAEYVNELGPKFTEKGFQYKKAILWIEKGNKFSIEKFEGFL